MWSLLNLGTFSCLGTIDINFFHESEMFNILPKTYSSAGLNFRISMSNRSQNIFDNKQDYKIKFIHRNYNGSIP